MTEDRRDQETEEQVEDLDVSAPEAEDVRGGGGKKGDKQDYLVVKLSDILISG